MAIFSQQLLRRARTGEPAALAELSRRGLLAAPGEDAASFAGRLEALEQNLLAMEEELRRNGKYAIEGMELDAGSRIPAALFNPPGGRTEALYGFRCAWVPGFFINPRFSLLFGGTAFYFYPKLFALFIIRGAFRCRSRWLWYQRDELLAHELCHVARLPLGSRDFEEHFAYQTASSPFRRAIGGIFHAECDVMLFLGGTLFLLLWQIVRAWRWPHWPALPGWLPLLAAVLFLALRHLRDTRDFRRATTRLEAHFGDATKARIALFHCTDAEIRRLARDSDPAAIRQWCATELRWQALRERLGG